MGETASKSELVDDARNEVIEEFQLIDIVSEYNSNTRESSIAQNQEFHINRQKFLEQCLEKGIFLEGLVTSVFMDDSSLSDVFESGITKASNLSELGDVQTLLSAIAHWCMKLHTESGKKRSQQVAWFHKNGFKETTFRAIDKHLRDRYTEVVALVSDLKKPTTLSFNKDVLLVHETMMEIMAKLWYNRLCIYQGHKDLGYMQISSNVSGLIGRESCYRLANKPPRFVLALDALKNNHIPQEVNLLVCIGDDLVSSILSKYHNTTPEDMVDQFVCIPVAPEYVSFELGSLASSEKCCERLKLICGHVIKVLYDRDLKELSILCPKVGCNRVKSVLQEELKSLQMELETKVLEIPFPNFNSLLRIQIGEGLKYLGITGFPLQEVDIRESSTSSHSSEAVEISATHEEDESFICKRKIEDLCNNQHLSATENSIAYECYTESLIAKRKNILVDDIVVFDSSVEVILHCSINDFKEKDEKRGNVSISYKDAKTIVIGDIIRMFAEAGLAADGRENSTAIWAQANSENANQFELKLVFPNVYAARVGARCIESISRSNFSVTIRHSSKLATDLKTIRIMMTPGFYQVIEKLLQNLLGRMKKANVESWIKQDPFLSLNPSYSNLRVLVSVTTTENCHTRSLTQTLNDFFQPAKVTFDDFQLHYLQSNDGTKFLKFLMQFTNTCIRLPEFHKEAHIYGDPSNKNQSAGILKRQMTRKRNSCGLSWYLFDLDNPCFNSNALKILYRNMSSHLDELKCNGDISQYFLFEDRPELWLETKVDAYSRYSEEIKSKLLQGMDVQLDKKGSSPIFMCSVCLCKDLKASRENCYLLSVCGHAYCRKCLLQLVIQSTRDRKVPVKCVFRKCDKAFSAAELWYICGVMRYYDIRKILGNVFRSFVIENAASFGLCPLERCGAMCVVYEQNKMKTCLWCLGRFCLQCDGDFHGTKTCDEVWSIEDWLRVDSKTRKRCPKCCIAIQKEEGCNVVVCAWCKNHICFKCGRFHSESNEECSAHARRCGIRDSDDVLDPCPSLLNKMYIKVTLG